MVDDASECDGDDADGVFFFQAEDGIRDDLVTGVQTCALPIFRSGAGLRRGRRRLCRRSGCAVPRIGRRPWRWRLEIGRAAGRERGEISVVAVSLKKKNRYEVQNRNIKYVIEASGDSEIVAVVV